MKELKLTRKSIWMLLLSCFMFPSCQDLDEYYEQSSELSGSGSIYQTLANEGNYSIFLKGAEIADYKPILDGKSILTVMAPDNDAMTQYLQENYGTTDITTLDPAEVSKLIGFHILYYSFDKDKLVNFRPEEGDGATDEELNMNAGLYYKFRTRSQDAITTAYDSTRRRNVQVYHNERMLPVFSHRMFQTKLIDAKENYEYFYPETGWTGNGGFNVANANVTQYEQVARNGYIYKVDRVLKPLETIYQEMKKAGKYSILLHQFDINEVYSYDSIQTRELQTSDSLFHHYHNAPLVNVDSEWGDVMDYTQMSALSSFGYTVFAPTDQAIQNFYNEYFQYGGWTWDEIRGDSALMTDILQSSVASSKTNNSIIFPGEIKNGTALNAYGEIISIDPDGVPQADRIVCSNGLLYGCDEFTPSAKYRAVTGPAYQYKDYSNFRLMMNASGLETTLTSSAVRYTMLFPSNEQLYKNAGIELVGGKLVSTASPNGLGSGAQTAYVNGHVASPIDGNSELPATGKKVIPTMTTDFKLYWYVKDGKITNSILHNNRLKYAANTVTDDQIWTTFEPLTYLGDPNGWTNGHAYTYDNLLFPGDYSAVNDNKMIRLMATNRTDASTEFYGWINLLIAAGIVDPGSGSMSTSFTVEQSHLMFIPTTQALENAIIEGKIPGVQANGAVAGSSAFFDNVQITDGAALTEYLKLYFVPLSTAPITNYPYIGWNENTAELGGLPTLQSETTLVGSSYVITSTNMNIYDDGTALYCTIIDRNTGAEGKRVKVSGAYDYFPFVYEDGPAHFIEDVF